MHALLNLLIIYIYIPGTQMTLVLVGKGLVLEGWPSKTEVSCGLGIYLYTYNHFQFSLYPTTSQKPLRTSRSFHGRIWKSWLTTWTSTATASWPSRNLSSWCIKWGEGGKPSREGRAKSGGFFCVSSACGFGCCCCCCWRRLSRCPIYKVLRKVYNEPTLTNQIWFVFGQNADV